MGKKAPTMLTEMEILPSLQLGEFTLELELGEPSAALLEIAKNELRESPERRKKAVEELRELLRAENDLKCPLDHEDWLVRFLRPTKYYPESALKLVKHYYSFKVKHANVYDGLRPSKETNIFEHNILTVLPNRDQFGRRILIIELGKKWKHNKCSLDEVFKGCVLYLEAATLEPASQIAGAVVIFDMDGLSLQQTWQFTPPFAKRIVDWLQDSVPLRIKNIHIVNQPYIFNMVFALFKPFLREKLKSRRKITPLAERWRRVASVAESSTKTSTTHRTATSSGTSRRAIDDWCYSVFSIYEYEGDLMPHDAALWIIFHGTDRKSLHQHLSPECLPESYGGTLSIPTVSGPQWLKLLMMCDQEYEAINSYGYKK